MMTFYFATLWEIVYEIVELAKPKQDKDVSLGQKKIKSALIGDRNGYRVKTRHTKMMGVSANK